MTVSRVVNRKENVLPDTRDRVMAAIQKLNYRPNEAARVLAGTRLARIALLYGNPSASYLSEVLVGALDEATQSNVQLVLEKCADGPGAIASVQRLIEDGVDGVILPPPFSDSAALVQLLTSAGIPTAVIASATPLGGAYAAMIDDSEAAFEMTRHLIAMGHRRIGFIAGDTNQMASARRLDGYRRALEAQGIGVDPALIDRGDFSYRSGLAATERLLALPTRPTAIFASNDDMAAAAIATAHRAHIAVPEELSICGFDDTALATSIAPELTTVRQPAATMAQSAVAMLAKAAREEISGGELQSETRLFPYLLVRRQSVAPLRSGESNGSH